MAISMTGNGTGLEPFLALVLLLLHFIVDSLQLCRAEFHPQRVGDRAINLVVCAQTTVAHNTALSQSQVKARA